MFVVSQDTHGKKPTRIKDAQIPRYLAIPEVQKRLRPKGYDPDTYLFIETTQEGSYLWSLNTKSRDDAVEIPSNEVENILNGKGMYARKYPDVRYLFVIEKFKMSMNVPSINTIIHARTRASLKLTEDVSITVQILQINGRAVRPYFGIDIEKCKFDGEDIYNPEQVKAYIDQKYKDHEQYEDLNKYMRYMNSHDIVMPKNLKHYVDSAIQWEEGYAASINLSVFNNSSVDYDDFDIVDACPCCEKTDCKKWIAYLTKTNINMMNSSEIDVEDENFSKISEILEAAE